MNRRPISFEAIEKFRHGDFIEINRGAALQLGNQLSAFDLRLAFRALKAMPAAFPPTGGGVFYVNDDCPMAGRTLADMPSHGLFSLLSSTTYPGLIAWEASRDRVQVSDHPAENLLISKNSFSYRRHPEDRTQTFKHGNQL